MVRQPIGFQAARGSAVDEQLKLRETWAAIWRADTPGPADDGSLFHRPTTDATRRILGSLGAVTGLGYDAVPPRAFNELPDQGIEALIGLIMLVERKCEWPNLCNRTVFIAKAAGTARPIGLLFAIIEEKVWEARVSFGPHTRVALSVALGSKQPGVKADGHAVATILHDLLKAFDHVAYQKLIDAAVRTRAQ